MVVKRNTTEEIVLCPHCNGKGYISHDERINAYESEAISETCYLCEGKRVVNKKVTINYEVIK